MRDWLLRTAFNEAASRGSVASDVVDVASATHQFESWISPAAWVSASSRRQSRVRTGNKLLWGVCLFSRQRIWRATHYRLLEELLVLMQPLALASFLGTISEQQNGSSTGPTSATVLSLAIFMFILHVARCLVRHHFEIGELLDMHLVPALPRIISPIVPLRTHRDAARWFAD